MQAHPKLDPRETHALIPSPEGGSLFLRHLPPTEARPTQGIVLYVHGGTFPSALSIAWRFDGYSWRDSLCDAGFHVWGLDFQGFGYSSRHDNPDATEPLCRTASASQQLHAAVRFILNHHGANRLSLIAHSWGCIVAGNLAARHPELIDRVIFFGPIAQRESPVDPVRLPPLRPISLQDQWDRFTGDVPPGEPPVLLERHFAEWGQAYLDTDPLSRTRQPPSVMTPSGGFQDIFDAWAGRLAYDPAQVQAQVRIIRGEWDSMCTDADAAWLIARLPYASEVKIPCATHLMHLEENRYALYRQAEAFLTAREV